MLPQFSATMVILKSRAMQIVDEATLHDGVDGAAALAAGERAFRALAEGRVTQPPPMGLAVEPVIGEVHVKGAYLRGAPIFAVKVASGFYANAKRGLPSGSPGAGVRRGDLMFTHKPYWISGNAASHGTAHLYDRRVPLILYGTGIRPWQYAGAATPADIAPTLARLIGVTLARPDGRVLTDALAP